MELLEARKLYAKTQEPTYIIDIENPKKLSVINTNHGFFLHGQITDKRIRSYIYQMLKNARKNLPNNYNFIIYEAYRSISTQIKLWDKMMEEMQLKYPNINPKSEEMINICDEFVANPYKQGSGHQSGASIDISLCNNQGVEYDMGGKIGEVDKAITLTNTISKAALGNRIILLSAMEKAGFTNYYFEWWHFSFGDRLWARLNNQKTAIFAKLDI